MTGNDHAADAAIRANPLLIGRAAYDASLRAAPHYHDGTARPQWAQLDALTRSTWKKPPRPLQDKSGTGPLSIVTQ